MIDRRDEAMSYFEQVMLSLRHVRSERVAGLDTAEDMELFMLNSMGFTGIY